MCVNLGGCEKEVMKLITDFARLFGVAIRIDERFIVKKKNRYFLLNDRLLESVTADFFYAGTYLGKIKDGRLFPSFNLLKIIAGQKRANKVFVDKKSEWLFVCGRDIFKRGIMKVVGSKSKGSYVLVLNRHGECLGFGKIIKDLDMIEKGVAVRNILDVGDFLRREQ